MKAKVLYKNGERSSLESPPGATYGGRPYTRTERCRSEARPKEAARD